MAAAKDTVFVNKGKESRARDLVALVNGTRSPRTQDEASKIAFWSEQLAEVPESEKVQFVYEALGGLVRTHAEQAKAEAQKAAAKKKGTGKK